MKNLAKLKNNKNNKSNIKNISSPESFKAYQEEFKASKKIFKDNPFQTKKIDQQYFSFYKPEKHYFNNEYAVRNILTVSIIIIIFALLTYISLFYNRHPSTNIISNNINPSITKTAKPDKTIPYLAFTDKELKKTVISSLKLKNDNLTTKDLNQIGELIISNTSKITSLVDITKFKNLQKISIQKNVSNIDSLKIYNSLNIDLNNINFNDLNIFKNIFYLKNFKGTINFTAEKLNSGFFTFLDSSTYEGEFINGIIKGSGKYIYPNGGLLEGNFNDIDFSGKAKLNYPNKKLLFDGLFDGKYTTKSQVNNYFDGKLSGIFYNKFNKKIFIGSYIGKNSLINNYFSGSLNGTYTSNAVSINGKISGQIPLEYQGNFIYDLDGTLNKNSENLFNGKFNITVENGKEIICKGNGVAKLPAELDQQGLYLEGALEYNISKKSYQVNGKSFRIINNQKMYVNPNQNKHAFPSIFRWLN